MLSPNYKIFLLLSCFCIITFWSVFIFFLMATYMPYNHFSPNKKIKLEVSLFMPEGWAFFTRNPREPNLYVYSVKNEKYKLINHLNSSFENYFGFSRGSRVMSIEMGKILEKIKPSSWKPTSNELKTIYIENKAFNPSIKGLFLIELREKTPWTWIKSYDSIKMPSKYVRVYIY